jgi:hypothetical protein
MINIPLQWKLRSWIFSISYLAPAHVDAESWNLVHSKEQIMFSILPKIFEEYLFIVKI